MRIQGNQVIGNLQQTSSYLTDTGSTDAYFVSFLPPITGYTEGLGVVFLASSDNTGDCTLEVDGYGPIPIVKNVNDILGASNILAGEIIYCIYKSGSFQMMNNPGQGTGLRFGFLGEDNVAGEDRNFDANTHTVTLTSIVDNGIQATLRANNTAATLGSSVAMWGHATHGIGVFAESDDYIALNAGLNGFGVTAGNFNALDGNAGIISTGGQNSAWLVLAGDASSVVSNVAIVRSTNVTPLNGIGQSIDFQSSLDGAGTFSNTINQIISKATNATSALVTSELSFTGVYAAATNTLLTLSGNGAARLNKYGLGTFTGTPAYNLVVDSSGNVAEHTFGMGGRFGVSGEDDTATQDRNFDVGNHAFGISSSTISPLGNIQLFGFNPSLKNIKIEVSDAVSGPLGSDVQISLMSDKIGSNAVIATMSAIDYTGGGVAQFACDGVNGQAVITASNYIVFNGYGVGGYPGTPANFLGVDSSGKVVETTITGAEGVVFDLPTTTLGLGRAQTDTGNTEATLSVDREVLTNGKSFRFYDTSTTNVTRKAELNPNTNAYVFQVFRNETASTKTTNKLTFGSWSEQFVQSGAVLEPMSTVFQSAVQINGNVTSTSTENKYSSNTFRNEFDGAGGYSGGSITLGSNGYGIGLFETDFEGAITSAFSGSLFHIGTRIKATAATNVDLDELVHISVNHAPLFSTAGGSTIATHVGLRIRNLKLTGVTTPIAIDQNGVDDAVNLAGVVKLTPRTATAASAITPAEGMIVMVSNTNGTFTSIGMWSYENGAWHKL